MNSPDPKLTTQTTPASNSTTNRRIHPLIATAAGAVIVASLAATAAITGVFPKASSNPEQSAQSQTGQTTVMASQPVVDSTHAATPATSAQYAQNTAPAQPTPIQQQQAQTAQAPAAPPPQYTQQQQYAQEAQQQQPACAACGVVESISATRQEGHGTGIGAVGGAVAGGVVGNQFGAGGGRTAMTLLGALGGGLAGNSVEKHLRSTTAYSVRVRMDNGKTRYFTYHEAPPFQQGQRVRIEHGTLAAA
ncbi:outer membrane lipoprotein SlyB [Paraburkholderia bannensis]|uniref:Outer membrane lipoprotein SlyB n=1 Tax=Paraburkholderia bannensis TaxID=765414 RepID=A0A7W9WPT2_9BURK|nr:MULTISPECIES: glycine zipper 2TM domain-containing protein [Paraburkholderia]MBB3256446.1 outer membrane lipoprotein SlyB [Paraburkholderia sp. WP4_3_2]MBB6101445.1 outer membrane lipoprotein SlyB [Paraburkholderia bannensis]